MTDNNKKFYIVHEDILPEAILKTAKAKEFIARGEADTVNIAVEKVGISRSAFYKYKDGVFPFYEASRNKIITLSFIVSHVSGVLSNILNTIAEAKGNILTINQNIPLQGIANVTVSIDTSGLADNVDELMQSINNLDGVKKVEIVGQS
jgi:chorismate mutase